MKYPNILFLFCDELNANFMSCAGHPQVKTPNIDRLAKEGIRFTNAWANNPICTPSRMSFLSGLYPSTHGYYGLYGHAPMEPITSMFSYFEKLGYRTGALGKLHTPRYWIEQHCQFVYDEFIEHPKYLEAVGLYEQNDNRHNYNGNGNRNGETSFLPLEHSCEVVLAKQAIRFMRNEGEPQDRGDKTAPWFAWVSFARPHEPVTPSEPFASMYPPGTLELPPVSDRESRIVLKKRERISNDELRKMVSKYTGLVSQVDYGIGIVLKELENSGELDNTVIVFSSDHGDYAGEHGLYGKTGGISYRAISRIPMIFRLPACQYGQSAKNAIMESVDLFPTLCQLAGAGIPNTVQGISQYDVICGRVSKVRDSALTENPYRKALATDEWRYIANLAGEDDELYNIKEDPRELNNLIRDTSCADIAARLLRQLFDRVARARKPVATLNGGWHKQAYDLDGRIDLNNCGKITPYW